MKSLFLLISESNVRSGLRRNGISPMFIMCLLMVLVGCESNKQMQVSMSELEERARAVVEDHLFKKELTLDGLSAFKSKAMPSPDFSFLYKAEGRCIEFLVYCDNNECKELKWYPYHQHGAECP